ncbi:hypothetical protein EMN47_18990 [Prolixibacteraceae bacterium JC049]|nr:hypothetical protein [Prolixibacteraceae bacterium JC049]
MKQAKKGFFKTYNLVIAALMAILGFTSCDDEGGMCEYGTPHALFKVNGKVTSVKTGQAVKDIQIIMGRDTVYTDASGNYKLEKSVDFAPDDNYDLNINDVDGESNGTFVNQKVDIDIKEVKFTGGSGSWDQGEATKTIDVKLEEK